MFTDPDLLASELFEFDTQEAEALEAYTQDLQLALRNAASDIATES
jgi:hypothetical protein